MNLDLQSILNSVWSIGIVVLFFGGSIFVHELGHFLAAKWRGLHIDRFSIGFGPKICSWRRGGVEYRLSWLPLGGYVSLPQLADMRGIEGSTSVDQASLPPISFSSKVIVAVAGAVFNVIFAFILASVLYFTGRPTNESRTSTEIGHLSQTLTTNKGEEVPAPAVTAGIKVGDIIRKIDGRPTDNWDDVQTGIALSSGVSSNGDREILFTVERNGELLDFKVRPIISEDYKIRQVGMLSGYTVIAAGISEKSPADLAGLEPGDVILSVDGIPIRNENTLIAYVQGKAGQELDVRVRRGETEHSLKITPVEKVVFTDGTKRALIGIAGFTTVTGIIHQTPIEQVKEVASTTLRNLESLINRNSDIGIGHMSGPAGIIRVIYVSSQVSILHTIWIVVFINISLAFFNLMPIPVLDGGHIVFATIQKLRNRPLNPNFIASVQGSFMLLLFSMIIYVSFFDVKRWIVDTSESNQAQRRAVPIVYGEESAEPASSDSPSATSSEGNQ